MVMPGRPLEKLARLLFPLLTLLITWQRRNFFRRSQTQLRSNISSSVADPDPGAGAFLTQGSGMGKKSRSGSGMNISDHISESLGTIFWVENILIFLCGSGSGIRNLRDPGSKIWDGKFGSGLHIPDLQQCSIYDSSTAFCYLSTVRIISCSNLNAGDAKTVR